MKNNKVKNTVWIVFYDSFGRQLADSSGYGRYGERLINISFLLFMRGRNIRERSRALLQQGEHMAAVIVSE